MKMIATRKSEQNARAIDPWTVVHLAAGLAMGLMNIPMKRSFSAALAYEIAEQWVERAEWGQELFETSGPEIIPNAIVDMVVFYAGHRLGQAWNATGSPSRAS